MTTWNYRSLRPNFQIILSIAAYEVIEMDAARIYFFSEDAQGAQRVATGIGDAMTLNTGMVWLSSPEAYRNLGCQGVSEPEFHARAVP
jgi:hypothetical protein